MSETVDPTLQLLESWNMETDLEKRNGILQKMTELGLFPDAAEELLETESGLYPDLPDPQAKLYNHRFLEKLLRKQEFIENRQESILDQFESDDDDLLKLLESDASACGAYSPDKVTNDGTTNVTPFELSPTQRFIGRFLSPKTPYNSALLFHGVGVGKTCSGVTVAENFLELFPKKQVFIVAPPTIQAGWLREIFNFRKLVVGKKDGIPNVHNGCTGNTYLRLSATEFERDTDVIRKKIGDVIKRRYKIMGYLQFYNFVVKYLNKNISKELKGELYEQEKRKYLSKRFSGGLLIVDEAHNLRDKETQIVEKPATVKEQPAAVVEEEEDDFENLLEEMNNLEDEEEEVVLAAQNENNSLENEVVLAAQNENNSLENEVVLAAQNENNSLENEDEEEEIELVRQAGGANNNNNDFFSENDDMEDEINLKPQVAQEVLAGEDEDTPIPAADKADVVKGKKVTPMLREILQASDGMKLLMLTATPMYNEYREIILLLNLLLMNDKKATVRESQIFQPNGEFAPGGRELLGRIAGSYVSFMRGENPLAFPIRLNPILDDSQMVLSWPSRQPDGSTIPDDERRQVINLPYVACPIPTENVEAFQTLSRKIIQRDKLTIPTTDKLIMAGNFLYPSPTEGNAEESLEQKVGKTGFQNAFKVTTKPLTFEPDPRIGGEWMLSELDDFAPPLEFHSPKAKFILDRTKTAKGVCFVYSRFVETGALTLALILEANGYTCASRKNPLLRLSEPIDGRGRQCALCPLRENEHQDHSSEPKEFVPAQYVLLTGEKDISPNNKTAIELATDPDNFDGKKVKIILGSTIASEGIDLKFLREVFVFDSWYHLSKLEQVIGRGIRYKSHCALPPLLRNCTINLLVLTYPDESNMETIDMYQYRNGFLKARLVGQVTRVLKEYALDCNLNKELILIQNLNTIQQIDGQGVLREEVDINDTPYTNICDWLETCDYRCKPEVDLDAVEIDYSTYDEYAAKWREHEIKRILRKVFEEQPWRHFDDIQNKVLGGIPRIAKASILQDIVGNKSFRIRVGDQEGYIIYKNGFYLFQPELLWDTNLPLALRVMSFPVKRDFYEPIPVEKPAPKPVAKPMAKPVAKAVAVNNDVEEEEIFEEEEEEEDLSQYNAFWKSTVDWSRAIANGTATKDTPKVLENILQSRYLSLGDKTVTGIKAMFEMVGRLYTTVKNRETLRKFLANVLLEYVWDEFLTVNEIQALYSSDSNSAEIKIAAQENALDLGGKSIFRFVDPKLKKIVYMCNGKPCEQSIIDGAEADDPISKLSANKTTTGSLYGLNAAKDGKILFKSNDAVNVGEKPAIGRLCYSVPNTKGHIELLNKISILAQSQPEVASDLDLSTAKTAGVKTPARLCTLADLSLRLLDKVGSGGKKYFYRPIAAVKTKHEGKGSK
jgi:hypothetical protein